MDFIDFDKHLEKKTGKTIIELFDKEGEKKFRLLEHEQLKKLVLRENVVISLGGGTPCFHNNIDLINKSGISVYLQMNADVLLKRLSKSKTKRPLIRDLNETDLRCFIEGNLEKRKQVYQMACFSIKASSLNEKEVTEAIANWYL